MLLNTHTHFSLNYGILAPEELVNELQLGGHSAFVLSDINNTSACMDVLRIAQEQGLSIGLGIDFRNGTEPSYIGIAKNMRGFRELNEHLSKHLHERTPFAKRAPLFDHAFIIYPFGKHPHALRENEYVGIATNQLSAIHLGRCTVKPERTVALHSCTFRHKKDHNAHRLLRAIGENCLLSHLSHAQQAPEQDRFLNCDELTHAYRTHPYLLSNARLLFEQCEISFAFNRTRNKAVWSSSAKADRQKLRALAEQGLKYRYPNGYSAIIIQRMEKELEMISRLNFCAYFLINWDLVRYSRHKGYFHIGRGSGANSLVAYLLRITDVDPIELDLYFERFINPHRSKPPDFDVDFSWADRQDVTRYLFDTHGHSHTALVGTYTTFKTRSVIRELGKVFGLPSEEIKRMQNHHYAHTIDSYGKLVLRYADHIAGLPNNLSVHASGILISQEPITSYCATFMPPKGYRTTQFDMQVAEDIGLHKFDILSQRGLGKIKDAVTFVKSNRGEQLDIHDISRFKKDPKVASILKKAQTIGCFYVESPAMRSLLTKLEADDYIRLVAASSIIRPGVAKSGMAREYILRYRDPERRKKAQQDLPELYKILQETYGVMVYQEDVIRVAHLFAGLSLAESDVLRRGMSWRFRQRNDFRVVMDKFFANCRAKGYAEGVIKRIWEQIESFANFAFAKGHSASYAVESYQALFLKAYYPIEYMVATLNNGGGFYRPELYLHEARLHGAEVELPCVNNSQVLNTVKGHVIHLGLIMLRGMEHATAELIVQSRNEHGAFKDIQDMVDRIAISLEQLVLLIRIGAFRFTGRDKKKLLWDAHNLLGDSRISQPCDDLFQIRAREYKLPQLWYHELEQAFDEMELLGFPLCDYFSLVEGELPSRLVVSDLRNKIGERISIVGYLIHRKTTQTHDKNRMSFGTLLDLDGQWLDTVQFPQVDARYPFRGPGCYLITGKVAVEFGFLTVETESLERLPSKSMEADSVRSKHYPGDDEKRHRERNKRKVSRR